MPALFDRLIKKSKSPLPNSRTRVQYSQDSTQDLTSSNTHVVHVDQRIHPDLNSLVEDIEPIRESFDTLNIPSDFAPLHPSPRRYTSSKNLPASDVIGDEVIVSNVSPSPGTSVTSAFGLMDVSQTNDETSRISMREPECFPPMGLEQNFPPPASIAHINSKDKWSTFGRAKALCEFDELVDTRSITPATPISTSKSERSRTRNDASISTLRSRSRSSAHDHENYTSPASSPHTFGIPTPPSSGFTFISRHRFYSSEKPPPLPPLDHPAFSAGPITRPVGTIRVKHSFSASLSGKGKTSRQQRQPRHAVSLPSFSNVSGNSVAFPGGTDRKRKRARTQSRIRVAGIFAGRSTPYQSSAGRNNPRHTRSHSRDDKDRRRTSAEFSAMQASSVSYGSELAGGWEAQVSREMLRISLGGRWELPDFKMVAGATELGPTRGDNLIRSNTLGSPFLLQDAHTHNIPGTTPDDHTRIGSNFVVIKTSQSESNLLVMTKDDGSKAPKATKDLVDPTSRRGKSSTPERTPSPPLSRLNTIPYPGPAAPSTSFLMPPSLSFTAPTPEASPISPVRNEQHQKLPTDPLVSVLRVPSTPPVARTISSSSHKGKRKADEAGVGGGATPPKEHKEPRATFAIGPRPHRESGTSGSSRAPSSYHRKRARLSTTPESRPASRTSGDNQTAATTGSWSSRGSGYPAPPHRPSPTHQEQLHRTPSRRSLSQASIPISALISPHAPSISRSATFHMRDPRKPAPIQSTPWSLAFPSSGNGPWVERGGSPLHAWLFFIGFVIFPIWWIAAFVGIPRTRRLGGTDVEKSVLLDDPQVEFDANSWRKRCRVMAAVSFLTYVPFVVLVAIFAR